MKKLIYVIQRHESRKLHFDLRLEMNNVLKSWAIPKEPSKKEGEKRLAIQVEDHDKNYANFEGEITEGYGKGKVKIWDKGSYELESLKPNKKIVFIIKGEKLKGRYCLLHFKPKEKNWLFFKVKEKE
jgi:DNA ligase D-like protein (predicted 3'-phosphoesterase)